MTIKYQGQCGLVERTMGMLRRDSMWLALGLRRTYGEDSEELDLEDRGFSTERVFARTQE